MEHLTLLHKVNIAIHVIAGSSALIIGIIALVSRKGRKLHRLVGRLFLYLMAVVILTGLIGVFVFGRNTFLLVITVLSGYMAFSGYRTIKTKSNKPNAIDIVASFSAVIVVSYFLYYFKSNGMIWSPVIIYSTVGYLFMIETYDLTRYFIPAKTYSHLWIHEHVLKMVSAFSGLLAAFSGTVLQQYQPYSQVIPSVLGTFIAIGFMVYVGRKKGFINGSKLKSQIQLVK
jgi:hypothetical protein